MARPRTRAIARILRGPPSLGAGLFGSEPDEIDQLHVECSSQARKGDPGWILLAALYARDGDGMQIGFGGESFDAQIATLAKVADRGSKLGESRWRHGGKSASRYRVD